MATLLHNLIDSSDESDDEVKNSVKLIDLMAESKW